MIRQGDVSVANVSQLFTVDKADLIEKIGTLPPERVQEILSGIYLLLEPRDLPGSQEQPAIPD